MATHVQTGALITDPHLPRNYVISESACRINVNVYVAPVAVLSGGISAEIGGTVMTEFKVKFQEGSAVAYRATTDTRAVIIVGMGDGQTARGVPARGTDAH